AVSDYRPSRRAAKKLPKSRLAISLRLLPTEDIAAALGRAKGKRITVGFAMEDHAGRRHAEAKMRKKNCDVIVLNGPANVGSDSAEVEVLVRGGRWQRWPAGSKYEIGVKIISELEEMVRPTGRGLITA